MKAIGQYFILSVVLVSFIFIAGFFYGRHCSRDAVLKQSVIAFKNREMINYDTEGFSYSDICIALGGMRKQCCALMRRLDKGAAGS